MGILVWIGSNSRRLAASLCFLVRAVLISGRTDPIAARCSWKIRRFMLQARLASVIQLFLRDIIRISSFFIVVVRHLGGSLRLKNDLKKSVFFCFFYVCR